MKAMKNIMKKSTTKNKFLCRPSGNSVVGPPATTQVENDPMDDYNRQMEEYNRKMAEYEAWQRAQGSQVVADTTEHE